jgi:hypothetical protein
MASYVTIEKKVVKLKEYPYSECIKNLNDINGYHSELYKYIITQNTSKYQQDHCIALCYQRFVLEQCSCYDANYPPPQYRKGFQVCSNLTEISCDFISFLSFFGDGVKVNELCSDDCPKECESVTYSKSLSMKTFPSRSFAKLAGNNSNIASKFPPGTNITYELLKENFVTVRVFYDKLAYTEITESEKISPFNFLSILGGNASLFLGVSLLSFIEVFEVIFEVLCILFQSKMTTVGSI